MTDASTSAPPPAHSFRPQSAAALWRQISTPHPTVGKARHLGEALVHAGLLSTPDLAEGLQAQQEERGNGVQRPIGQILVDRGALTRDQLRSVIATWLGEYTVHPGDITPEASALALIPRAVAERESVLPLIARDDALVLLMADPWDRVLIDEIRFLTQRRLIPLRASPGTPVPAILKAYRTRPADAGGAAPGARATSQELLTNLATASPDADTEQADVISESDNTLVRLINSVIDEPSATGRRTSTSRPSPPRTTCACACASTATWCPTWSCPRATALRWWPASRSWPAWTSRSTANRRTARSTLGNAEQVPRAPRTPALGGLQRCKSSR